MIQRLLIFNAYVRKTFSLRVDTQKVGSFSISRYIMLVLSAAISSNHLTLTPRPASSQLPRQITVTDSTVVAVVPVEFAWWFVWRLGWAPTGWIMVLSNRAELAAGLAVRAAAGVNVVWGITKPEVQTMEDLPPYETELRRLITISDGLPPIRWTQGGGDGDPYPPSRVRERSVHPLPTPVRWFVFAVSAQSWVLAGRERCPWDWRGLTEVGMRRGLLTPAPPCRQRGVPADRDPRTARRVGEGGAGRRGRDDGGGSGGGRWWTPGGGGDAGHRDGATSWRQAGGREGDGEDGGGQEVRAALRLTPTRWCLLDREVQWKRSSICNVIVPPIFPA